MLSPDQKREFVRDGVLVIESELDADLVDEARTLLWDELPENSNANHETLIGIGSRSPDIPADEPFTELNRQLYEYASDLAGEEIPPPDGPNMQLAFRYPREFRLGEHYDRIPSFGHLDGYGPRFKQEGEYGGFTVGAVIYFDDVVDRGGGFTVWPGSHWIAANYFEDHHYHAPGYHGRLPAIQEDGGWDYANHFDVQARSREIAAPAGSIILWHNKLMHSSGVNQSENIRMAGIQRFTREDHAEIREDAADKPFKYWSGVDDAESSAPRVRSRNDDSP